jgi:uncharacterized protein YyaL (SSP411 family)
MKLIRHLAFALLGILLTSSITHAAEKIDWVGWTPDLFQKSAQQNRLVILDLEAVWCHWCHVMEEKTYSNPKVIKLIQAHYIAVKVDQDSRPDLSNRYEDYGWPATIIFDSKGKEIAKRAGYIAPEQMESILQAFIDDPTPGPSAKGLEKAAAPESAYLTKAQRQKFSKNYDDSYDQKEKGWVSLHKYLPRPNVELLLLESQKNGGASEKQAKETLQIAQKLVDPVWGGVYQYSIPGWGSPHFEKIMAVQADNLFAYSLAYAEWKNPKDLAVVESINRFLNDFLKSPEGAYYTSQDADLVQGQHSAAFFKLNDKARRAKGIPRVDQNIYSRENGWIAEALADATEATGDEKFSLEAKKALEWIIANRSLGAGGFKHGDHDSAGPYLGDTLAMARAFLAMYTASADRVWLTRATESAKFIASHFSNIDSTSKRPYGFSTTASSEAQALSNIVERDENISLGRFANLLYQYSGDAQFKAMAEQAMKYAVTDGVAESGEVSALLLADDELNSEPLHLTVVGKKSDSMARALFNAALAYPETYKRAEFWDKSEGNLPRGDVTYPEIAKPALFICTSSRCSFPIFNPGDVNAKIVANLKAH